MHYASSTRSKFSIHLKSQYQGVKFDPAKAGPLVQAFVTKGVPVSQEKLGALMASSPDLPKLQAFARECLAEAKELSEEDRKELEAGIEALGAAVETSPANGNGTAEVVKLREGNVAVEDIGAFKAGLTSSTAAVPVKSYQVVLA